MDEFESEVGHSGSPFAGSGVCRARRAQPRPPPPPPGGGDYRGALLLHGIEACGRHLAVEGGRRGHMLLHRPGLGASAAARSAPLLGRCCRPAYLANAPPLVLLLPQAFGYHGGCSVRSSTFCCIPHSTAVDRVDPLSFTSPSTPTLGRSIWERPTGSVISRRGCCRCG